MPREKKEVNMKKVSWSVAVAGLAVWTVFASGVKTACPQASCSGCAVRAQTSCPGCTAECPAKKRISAAAAKEIALKHAGVAETDVRGYSCQLDREDGVWVYEIEFEANGFEYDYDVEAATGKILKAKKERD
jgi:uncharacterized membrane protein YkoI